MGIGDFFSNLFSGKRRVRENLDFISEFLEHSEIEEVKRLLRTHKARFAYGNFETSKDFLEKSSYLSLACNVVNVEIKSKVADINKKIVEQSKKKLFKEFSEGAENKILSLMTPNISAFNPVKYAALAQLFSNKNVHILMMGDPEIDKKALLKSISALAPNSVFTSGMGSKEAGLTVALKDASIVKGSLAKVDKGVAYIDNLNLLQTIDRAGLIDAMHKGIIEYRTKGGKSLEVPASVKVFASANPEGESFVGNIISVLKKQIPFDAAVYSKFHLVFLLRNKDVFSSDENSGSGKKSNALDAINNNNDDTPENKAFVREYVKFALKQEVEFDKELTSMIQGFVNDIQKDKDQFMFKISTSSVVSIVEFAKAFARLNLREKVEKKDVIKVLKIFNSALYMKNDFKELLS